MAGNGSSERRTASTLRSVQSASKGKRHGSSQRQHPKATEAYLKSGWEAASGPRGMLGAVRDAVVGKRRRRRSGSACGTVAPWVGAASLVAFVVTLVMFRDLQDFVWDVIRKQLAVTSGSVMFGLWSEPPVSTILRAYVYNFTNVAAFLDGTDATPRVEELGPYVYRARHVNRPDGWNASAGSVTFRSKATYENIPHMGRDDREVVVVPNIVMFSGMLKDDVLALPEFLKSGVVWPILNSVGRKQPVIAVKARDFIWGYEDELACIKQKVGGGLGGGDYVDNDGPGEAMFDDGDDESPFFAEAEPQRRAWVQKEKDFRDPATGKCMFGVLAERNGSWSDPITASDGSRGIYAKGVVESIGGAVELGAWRSGSSCDRIPGMQDPYLNPPLSPNSTVQNVFVNAMCRSVPFQRRKGDLHYKGAIRAVRLSPPVKTFHRQDARESCYFDDGTMGRIPEGVMPVPKCCEGCPLAVSFPHFLHADPWYRKQVEGVKAPSESADLPYMDVEPHLGALLAVQVRFQVNILLRRDEAFPPLSKINSTSPLTVLPLFWAEEGYSKLPDSTLMLVDFALRVPCFVPSLMLALAIVTSILCFLAPHFSSLHQYWTGLCVRYLVKRKEVLELKLGESDIQFLHAEESKTSDGSCDKHSPLLPYGLYGNAPSS